MIASPGDVQVERNIAREVINDWNAVHSMSRRIVLQPVGWESHSTPAMGDRPQAIINSQVLESADLLIAIFWTRLGTPTGEAESGTVEEIRKHADAGKPAMIYFSSAPVRPDSVDEQQYAALKEFRNECREKGLIEMFDNQNNFRQKFARHLASTLNSNEYFTAASAAFESEFSPLIEERQDIPSLSKEATELLLEAVKDPHGHIMRLRRMSDVVVQTNGKIFVKGGNARSRALWEGVVDELDTQVLIKDVGDKGEVYKVTREGYELADLLKP